MISNTVPCNICLVLSNAAKMLGLHYIPDIIKFINVNPFDLVFHFSHVYLFFNRFGLHLTIFFTYYHLLYKFLNGYLFTSDSEWKDTLPANYTMCYLEKKISHCNFWYIIPSHLFFPSENSPGFGSSDGPFYHSWTSQKSWCEQGSKCWGYVDLSVS